MIIRKTTVRYGNTPIGFTAHAPSFTIVNIRRTAIKQIRFVVDAGRRIPRGGRSVMAAPQCLTTGTPSETALECTRSRIRSRLDSLAEAALRLV